MIQVARRYQPVEPVWYTGIDLFEDRPSMSPGMTLIQAHRRLKRLGAKVRLVPGDPATALTRNANSLLRTDLIVVSAYQDPCSLAQAWFYVPRMLHEGSLVFVEQPISGGLKTQFQLLTPADVSHLAAAANRGARRAA